jgi:pimeloyl-ACP methyl ester carboxylesterase
MAGPMAQRASAERTFGGEALHRRSSAWRRARVAATALAALLAVAAATGLLYEEIGRRRDRERLPRVGEAVDIGERQLNMLCSGTGQPAVIILSANAQPGYAWSHIQPKIATYTRACWFDRPGEGWSDPGPYPRSSAETMKDLHRALQRARIAPPYVLVGHSLGGLEARVFTGLYPAEVSGLVLADAAHEAEPRQAPQAYLGHTVPRALWHPADLLIRASARLGIVRVMTPAVDLPANPARRTRTQIVHALASQPLAIASVQVAGVVGPDSYLQAARSGTLGDRPLIVLTRGKQPDTGYERIWMHEIQASLAHLSTQGRQVILTTSGHMIPEEAPEAILEAVRSVVASVRAQPAGPERGWPTDRTPRQRLTPRGTQGFHMEPAYSRRRPRPSAPLACVASPHPWPYARAPARSAHPDRG